jgi:hypothetical protein
MTWRTWWRRRTLRVGGGPFGVWGWVGLQWGGAAVGAECWGLSGSSGRHAERAGALSSQPASTPCTYPPGLMVMLDVVTNHIGPCDIAMAVPFDHEHHYHDCGGAGGRRGRACCGAAWIMGARSESGSSPVRKAARATAPVPPPPPAPRRVPRPPPAAQQAATTTAASPRPPSMQPTRRRSSTAACRGCGTSTRATPSCGRRCGPCSAARWGSRADSLSCSRSPCVPALSSLHPAAHNHRHHLLPRPTPTSSPPPPQPAPVVGLKPYGPLLPRRPPRRRRRGDAARLPAGAVGRGGGVHARRGLVHR